MKNIDDVIEKDHEVILTILPKAYEIYSARLVADTIINFLSNHSLKDAEMEALHEVDNYGICRFKGLQIVRRVRYTEKERLELYRQYLKDHPEEDIVDISCIPSMVILNDNDL